MSLEIEWEEHTADLWWSLASLEDLAQHDPNKITEDGAEVVALAIAHRSNGWQVVRRMDEEHADWLLGNGEATLALEVSGVAHGSITKRLTEKLRQVLNAEDVRERWACVVGFEQPRAVVRAPEE